MATGKRQLRRRAAAVSSAAKAGETATGAGPAAGSMAGEGPLFVRLVIGAPAVASRAGYSLWGALSLYAVFREMRAVGP